jgi:hypothetical protein
MNTKFTEGPWVKDKRGESLIGSNGKSVIIYDCGLSGGSVKTPEYVANSHLISAAPAMYKIIESLLSLGEELLSIDEQEDAEDAATVHSNFNDKILEAAALLVKARGESNGY